MTNDPPEAFKALLEGLSGPRLKTAVVHPVDGRALAGAIEARAAGLIEPVLVGPASRIYEAAKAAGLSLDGLELIDTPHSHAAAATAVALASSGKVGALMKGSLHTDELMKACVSANGGLRTDRRMSHVFLLQTDAYPKWLLITDGALNVAPDLACKRWIVQNAIDLAHAVGITEPKVAILSATEEVDPGIPSTIDAAALCKMADRGQIKGGLVDGPLAFDLAISAKSVAAKGLKSKVAGDADILVVPTLEAGNMLAKELDYLAGAAAAGIVLGASVPIILTSRADSAAERVASCALARRFAAWQAGK